MQKLKTRNEKSKSAARALSLAIRCGANLLPLKGLLYAMAHAKASRHVTGSSKEQVRISLRRLNRQMKELAMLADDLQSMKDISGEELHKGIKRATATYVELFYNLNNDDRDSYLTSCSGHNSKKIANEQNLLLIPALMASRGESKDEITDFLSNNIYKIPFRVLYHSSKAAVHIELLEQAMGIKNAPEALIKNFSNALGNMVKCMDAIEQGSISPVADESLKQEFVDEAVLLSQQTDMKIADFISEKVMPSAFTDRMARRIVRKIAAK